MNGLGNIVSRRSLSTLCVIAGWGLWISGLFVPAVVSSNIETGAPEIEYGAVCLFYCMFPPMWLFAPLLLMYAYTNVAFFMAPFFMLTTSANRLMFIRVALLGAVVLASTVFGAFQRLLLGGYLWGAAIALTAVGLWLWPLRRAYAY